jgi:hypothetical protein
MQRFINEKPGTTFLIATVIAVVLAVVIPTCARAQTWHGYTVSQPPADCNLKRVSSDNFIGDGRRGTITAPRYQLHAISIGTSVVASYAVRKVFRLGPVKSAAIGGLGVGLLPHVRSVLIQRRYPIDPGDIVADATMRMAPFMVAVGHHDHSASAHFLAGVSVVASYFAVACWAHP